MRFQILLLLMWVISLNSPADANGEAGLQGTEPANGAVKKYSAPKKNVVEMHFCYSFFVPGKTSKIKLLVALPRTVPERQKIRWVKYFPEPSRELTSKCGNQYAEFILTQPSRQFDVEVHIEAELLRYDLSTQIEKYGKGINPRYDAEDFLGDEGGTEWDDPSIRRIARNINGQSEIETVKNIYDYVIDNMEYCTYDGNEGATYAAKQKRGDCSEYSGLFVALCRAKKIPARVVTGYTVRVDDGELRHSWAEVYLKKYGWVPFDPTWGDQEDHQLQEELFHTMKPVYIYIKYPDKKDEVINDIGEIAYQWWGDEIEMEDSLKFKRWELKRPALKERIPTIKPKATYGVVGGILYSKDNPLAIIDGKILKEGDTIHGVKVVKIYETKVEFEKNGLEWTQQVGETTSEFWW